MRIWNRFAIFVLLLAAAFPLGTVPARSAGADWPPIDPAELAMTDNSASTGSLAMVLFREEIANDKEFTDNYYYRIKIFTEAGKKHADIEIPFVKGFYDVKDLRARTIHPDGKIIDFSGQVLEKLVVKSGDIKVQAKTFTFPDVTPGSIVEYRYKVQKQPSLYDVVWRIQEELYTKRAHFAFQPYPGDTQYGIVWRAAHLDKSVAPQKQKDGSWSLDVHDVPGLPDEDYMLPADELREHVEFIYDKDQHFPEAKQYWDNVARSKFQFQDEFIGKRGSIRDLVGKLTTNADSPEQKLRKLYARAQEIHNVDADREKTSQEAKREKTKDNNNVDDVMKHGTGDSGDIDFFFVALAQAVGFDSGIVWIAPRNERRFDPGMQDRRMLDDFLVWVHAGDKDYFLDPGSSLCPFGQLPWYETAVTGLRPTKQGAVFMPVPAANGVDSAIARRAQLKLDESDGSMSGTLMVTYTGQRALTRRKDARKEDETGKNKMITDEVKTWFPTNAKFELISITGWDKPDVPLEVQGKLTLPGMAESVGRRVLLPLGVYEAGHPQLFQTTNRKQDIYFHFPYVEQDDITIQVPQGWHAESLPEPDVIDPGGQLRYEISAKQDGDALHVQRKLIVGGIVYPVDSYMAVRKFFGAAKEGDEKQVVLQTTPSSK
jgi:hypothetical protein